MSQPNPTPFASKAARPNCPPGQYSPEPPPEMPEGTIPGSGAPSQSDTPQAEPDETACGDSPGAQRETPNAGCARSRSAARNKRLVPQGEATRPPLNATQRLLLLDAWRRRIRGGMLSRLFVANEYG
jgi:hypothetical protein